MRTMMMQTGSYTVDLAGPTDDAELGRLLRDNPMAGNIPLTLRCWQAEEALAVALGTNSSAWRLVPGCQVAPRRSLTRYASAISPAASTIEKPELSSIMS